MSALWLREGAAWGARAQAQVDACAAAMVDAPLPDGAVRSAAAAPPPHPTKKRRGSRAVQPPCSACICMHPQLSRASHHTRLRKVAPPLKTARPAPCLPPSPPVLQIALGKLRLRLWRRWEAQAQAEAASGRPNPLLASPSRVGYWHDWRGSSRSLFGHALEPPHEEDGGAGGRDAAPCAGAAAAAAAGSEGSAGSSEGGKPGDLEAAGDAPKSEAGLPAGAAGSCTGAATVQSRRGAGAAVKSSRERLSEWAGAVRLRWRFQPPQFTSVGHYLAEGLICFVQALSPNTGAGRAREQQVLWLRCEG